MASELAPVTASVLKWARQNSGVSVEDAAKRAAVTVERLESWEAGTAEPTLAKLRVLGTMYGRPLAIFFLPEPPTGYSTPRDFRKLPDEPARRWSRGLHRVWRRALEQQDVAVELLEDEDEAPVFQVPALTLEMDPEDAGAMARAALGVSLQTQFGWTKPDDAFYGWLNAVEDHGVLVLRTGDVEVREMRGLSLSSERLPVIVVNATDTPRGQVFTLAHEFVHLMLHQSGLCNLLEPNDDATRRTERFCNAVAAAVLMPADAFVDHDLVRAPGIRQWDDDQLARLSNRWGVSREAILRRLLTLKRASKKLYEAKREEYLDAYAEHREQEKARRRAQGSKGGPPPYRMAMRDQGRPYVRLVLDAYERQAITPSSLSNLLGLKLKHLPKLEHELGLHQ
ncbi:MAG: ImmA/IrrE family metallo-endopeptidase [Acidimicrobiales bacterium]